MALVSTLLAAACTTTKTEAPALSGPSELGLSVSLAANPDTIPKDGASQSTVIITARNANGQPAPGVGMRVETWVGGTLMDYGRLSTKSLVTGSDGRAQVVYTAPPGQPSGDQDEIVRISVTPAGTDFSNAFSRDVLIRLTPQGVVLPPSGEPTAKFTFAPQSPSQGQEVAFDASASTDHDGSRSGLSYAWDFGDGSGSEGVAARHRYDRAGSWTVTLTVTNARGYANRATAFVNVGISGNPTAAFSVSPTNPEPGQSVFFNGGLSTATAGHTVTGYTWDFGDGGRASGVAVSHRFEKAGTFVVALTVFDDVGKNATATQSVSVAPKTTTTGVSR
jgi:PKD repeat protein